MACPFIVFTTVTIYNSLAIHSENIVEFVKMPFHIMARHGIVVIATVLTIVTLVIPTPVLSFSSSSSFSSSRTTGSAATAFDGTRILFTDDVRTNRISQMRRSVWRSESNISRNTVQMTSIASSEETGGVSNELSSSSSSSKTVIGKSLFILPHNANDVKSKFGSNSPYGSPSILEAVEQLQRKAKWFSDDMVVADIILMPENEEDFPNIIKQKALDADVLVVFNLERDIDISYVNDLFQMRKETSSIDEKEVGQFALDCNKGGSSKLLSLCGPYDPESPSISTVFAWSRTASAKRLDEQMIELFDRWTTDDFTYALMLFFNQYYAPIDWVKHSIDATWEKGPVTNAKEFYNMITKCGDCVQKCVADENCKECLDALTAVDTSDQVASYRTIVSYESELLRDFSFCILQKNNIFNCDAKIPTLPVVTPMKTFRDKPLTKEVARKILIGHLDDDSSLDGSENTDISWKVAAGANVAYDQFPSQNQIFYEAIGGKSMWYDPIFRVETIDGRQVWAKRHYRVRDGKVPGTFRFSVLDNGVTSDEFWTLVDCADDLSYVIMHYAGAAASVGQRYLGGLLCTADGSLPSESERNETIYPKLRSAGIEPFELFAVDNTDKSPGAIAAGSPPLDFYRKDILEKKEEKKKEMQSNI